MGATAIRLSSLASGYRVVHRRLWIWRGRSWWTRRRVPASGCGAGLAPWLAAALPGTVLPVVFGSSSKSELGWRLMGLVESGRLKDYGPDGSEETRLFWRQLAAVGDAVRPGPGKLLRWGVEDAVLHDDLVLSLALCGVLDEVDWRPRVARGGGGG